jgi:TRAP-type C4-dicarboxylate transport system substrate-binding protein
MKRTLVAILLLTIVFGGGLSAQARTIKLGTLAPHGSPWYQIFRDMAEEWKVASGGSIEVRIYPGGVAGDEADMVRKMRIGQLHAAALTGAGLSGIAPEVQALQMPLMFESDEELDYVRDRISPALEAILDTRGFKLLTWGDAGWVHFFTQKPVVRPDDLKPLKLFIWSADSDYIELWKDFGFQPVPLAATDIHTALQSGLINAFTTTPIAALSFQWFALAPHLTDLKWAPLVGAIVISSRTWETIREATRPLLLAAAHEAGARTQRRVRELGGEAVEVMKKHGLVVHHVPRATAALWERSVRAGYPRIVGRLVPADMVARVERLRAEYRALRKRQ